jgi:hypothetical protein
MRLVGTLALSSILSALLISSLQISAMAQGELGDPVPQLTIETVRSWCFYFSQGNCEGTWSQPEPHRVAYQTPATTSCGPTFAIPHYVSHTTTEPGGAESAVPYRVLYVQNSLLPPVVVGIRLRNRQCLFNRFYASTRNVGHAT